MDTPARLGGRNMQEIPAQRFLQKKRRFQLGMTSWYSTTALTFQGHHLPWVSKVLNTSGDSYTCSFCLNSVIPELCRTCVHLGEAFWELPPRTSFPNTGKIISFINAEQQGGNLPNDPGLKSHRILRTEHQEWLCSFCPSGEKVKSKDVPLLVAEGIFVLL